MKDFAAATFRLHLALDPDLDEQHLGDLVERGGGVQLLAVADDVVALVQQVGELVFFEDLEFRDQLFNLLVAGVGVRDVLDLLQ